MNATADEIDKAPPHAEVDDPAADAAEQRDAEAEAEADARGLTPWVSLTPSGLTQLRVRAGYINGDGQWQAVTIDATVDVEQGQQVAAVAVEWYRRTVADVVQRAAAAQAEEGDEE